MCFALCIREIVRVNLESRIGGFDCLRESFFVQHFGQLSPCLDRRFDGIGFRIDVDGNQVLQILSARSNDRDTHFTRWEILHLLQRHPNLTLGCLVVDGLGFLVHTLNKRTDVFVFKHLRPHQLGQCLLNIVNL